MPDDTNIAVTKIANSRTASLRSRLPIVIAIGLTLLSIVGGIIRLGPRDEIQSLAIVFYATPPLVLTATALFALLLVGNRETKAKWPIAAVAIVQCCLLIPEWNQPAPNDPPTDSVTIGFWNVGGGTLGWNGITKQAKSWNAALIGLAESNLDTDKASHNFWETQFPDHTVLKFPRGMRLISKYPARIVAEGELAERSFYGIAEVQIANQSVRVVMADLLSGPQLPRGPSFEALIKILDQLPTGPMILMGDMNTPTESVHLKALRSRLGNAFEEQGTGFYCTWPTPCPVLPLDQVWTNNAVEITSCKLEWTLQSDHRPIVSTFKLREEPIPRADFEFTSLTRSDFDRPELNQTQGM
jgi:endonuclease/exonuclease/phosphatase family metal-dependent hydrolase